MERSYFVCVHSHGYVVCVCVHSHDYFVGVHSHVFAIIGTTF